MSDDGGIGELADIVMACLCGIVLLGVCKQILQAVVDLIGSGLI